VIGPLWGIARTYLLAAAVTWIGRLLGGRGTFRELRGAFAWALLPMIAWLAVWTPFFLLMGRDVFRLGPQAASGHGLAMVLFGALTLGAAVAIIWHLVRLTTGVATQHGFGVLRAELSLLLGVIVPALLFILVVLAL
jgi:dolichyl-phosphate-mannose--protein O-mannosyl transferase